MNFEEYSKIEYYNRVRRLASAPVVDEWAGPLKTDPRYRLVNEYVGVFTLLVLKRGVWLPAILEEHSGVHFLALCNRIAELKGAFPYGDHSGLGT